MTAPAPAIDLRRAPCGKDRGAIVNDVIDGAESLLALVSAWPLQPLCEGHVIGAERSLVALQNLLVALRRHVPASDRRDD